MQEHNLACEVAGLKDGMTIELHNPESTVAMYKLNAPTHSGSNNTNSR